jgi:hypothetical protein
MTRIHNIYLLILLTFFASCSQDSTEEVISSERSLEEVLTEQASPETYEVADVYYAGVKLPVEKYDGNYIYQGDIILSKDLVSEEPVKLVYERGETPPKNKSVGRTSARWPNNTVYYAIDPELTNTQRIYDAMKHWAENTNILFLERSTEANYVYFQDGEGCSSHVGMIGGKQEITLNENCSTGNTIHEIGHAIGLWHEHSRVDRDIYVNILYENIEEDKLHNFYTYVEQFLDGAEFTNDLDFNSIMMYSSFAFSVSKYNDKPTIVKKDGSTFETNRTHLSQGDIQGVAEMYDYSTTERTFNNGRFYTMNGLLVYRMHDRWYYYSPSGWREVAYNQENWFYAD